MNKLLNLKGVQPFCTSLSKIPLIMRITLVLLFVFAINMNAEYSYSQSARISLDIKNSSVEKVLQTIEQKSDFYFLYSNRLIDVDRTVSVKVENEAISSILDNLFSSDDVEYEVKGTQIVLSPKEIAETATVAEQNVQQDGKTVTGRVVDAQGETIIGANIIEKGTSNGTITDFDGNFTLQVSDDAVLRISYIGYLEQEVSTVGRNTINVTLVEDTKTLDELVVVGYGVQKKANLTGAVSQVKMEEVLGDRPVSNAFNALQGSIPGLTVSGGSSPGQSGRNINIRGTLSINGGSPLVLIDNVPGDLNMVNPEDIESVSVLKDAASSAIYGARAANGVVLITTKRPSSNTSFKLQYNNNIGFTTATNYIQQSSLDEYFEAYQDAGFSNQYWSNSQDITKWRKYLADYKQNPGSFNIIGDGIYVDETGTPYFLNEKNLAKNILETGIYQKHNVSASGGTDKVRYRMSAGFNTEDGPIITNKDRFKRFNVSSFISADMTDWFTQELDIKFARSENSMPIGKGNPIFNMRLINYYPEGMMPGEITQTGEEVPIFTPRNVVKYSTKDNTTRNNPRIFSKSIIKPLEDLQLVFEYTFDKKDTDYSFYNEKWKHTTIQTAVSVAPTNDVYTRRRFFTDYSSINAYGNYSKSFGKHNFQVMAGYNQESSYYEYIQNQVKDQVSSVIPSLGNSTGEMTNTEIYSEYTIRSGFYRLNYNFEDRYLLEFNGRYDGSSKFPKNDRFGFFPSVSAGWQLGREDFMSFTNDWMEELKVRASWGEIGNQAVEPYQFAPSMDINNSNSVWLENGEKVTTIGLPSLVSSNFTWETVETVDIGVDFSFLNYRLRGTFDWYQRDTKGMLTKAGVVELPGVVGTDAPAQNGADLRTRGWEFGLTWKDEIGKVGYSIGFNVYDHISEISKYANESGLLSDYYVGSKLGEIWGYVSNGYYTIGDFENTSNWQLKEGVPSIQGYNVRPGDIKFKNLMDSDNSTNRIDAGNNTLNNPGDRKIIGNNTSRYQLGSNIGINYEGFSLNIMLQGVAKRDAWIDGQAIFPFAGSGASDAIFRPLYSNQTDYWKPISEDPNDPKYMIPENPNAEHFRIYGQMNNVGSNTRVSDKYLQNAAYLRIKNVTLSYVFPKNIVNQMTLSQLKLFAGVENLATFSSLPKGIDPEILSWNYPFYRTVSFGLNVTF